MQISPQHRPLPPPGPTPPPHQPEPSALRAIVPQAAMFAGGVAGLFGVFEVAAPLITLAGTVDPTLVLPARVGAAAAIGAAGASAVTLMESAYETVTHAKLAACDKNVNFAAELPHKAAEQKAHLPNELLKASLAAAATGALFGGLVGSFPATVIWTLAGAVGLSLTYSVGSLGFHSFRALRSFKRARDDARLGNDDSASRHSSAGRHSVQAAGLALLETATVAAVTNHLIVEVHHLIAEPDNGNATKVVASSAEQVPGALESVGEVAEALAIGVREAGEAAIAVRAQLRGLPQSHS